jgi:aspartyl-tRNA(Asn)/glutamyl-tRNA(Gln) amidotransferase subunit A
MALEEQLTWAPAWQIRAWLAKREVSAVEVVDHFLSRIEELEPKVHAFRFIDVAGAREQAQRAERHLARGEDAGALCGIPVSVKEHIAVKDLPYWTINSLPHADKSGSPYQGNAPRDSILVERLRKSGAIIVGTTVMPGFGIDPLTPDLSKHARNPWNLQRIPGSSSAGGAASVAAGMTPISIGSDGAGSIRLPAALSGLVGFHPTPGRIPGIDYENPSVVRGSTFGPLARDVRDAALVMQSLAGPDGRDLFEIQSAPPDYLGPLEAGVRGLRFAWTDDFGYGSIYAVAETPAVIAAIREAAFAFRSIGATVEHIAEQWEDFFPTFLAMTAAYDTPMTIAYFKATQTPESLRVAHETYGRNWHRFQRLFSNYDLLISPTIQFTAPTVETWDAFVKDPSHPHGHFMPKYGATTQIFNILGWPAISIPCGFVNGMPVGMQIIGRPEQEALLLRAAQAFLAANPFADHPNLTLQNQGER